MDRKGLLLLIIVFLVSINVSFADNSTDIYVSNDGDDVVGNGSIDNPYQTLNHTIEIASNNSNIYLKSGTYNSMGYTINKSVSIFGVGDVTLDGCGGNYSQHFFKISSNASLFLNNIKFVNGYTDLDGMILSTFVNDGNLSIVNSIFDNFTNVYGVIKNNNNLYINNVSTSNLESDTYLVNNPSIKIRDSFGQFITNMGHCEIYNSTFFSVYNCNYMLISNSNLENFISNKRLSSDYLIYSYIYSSKIQRLLVSSNELLLINDSVIYSNFIPAGQTYGNLSHTINSSNIFIVNSNFMENPFYQESSLTYYILVTGSNVTAISTVFDNHFSFSDSNLNISYSVILKGINFNLNNTNNDLNYNWWGSNKGPDFLKNPHSKVTVNRWIVMRLINIDNSTFTVDLTKCSNGVNIWDLKDVNLLPTRFVSFEPEIGNLTCNSGYLINSSLNTTLLESDLNTIFHAKVDNQALRTLVGSGFTNLTWYVSDREGNDYFNDGSLENPFKTLSCVVSHAYSGNTIYVMDGNYTLGWNANLKISKTLKFIGLGNAQILRPNNRNVFIVDEKGSLTLDNFNFTSATSDKYYNPLIYLTGGNVKIINSNFYDIMSGGVIYSDLSDNITLFNVTFNNILGPAVFGCSTDILINHCNFFNGTCYVFNIDERNVQRDHIFYIAVVSNLYVVDCRFEDNTEGFIRFNPDNVLQKDFMYINVINSTFSNNNLEAENAYKCGLKLNGYDPYGQISKIEGCSFYNNVGHLGFSDQINNSTFINNTARPFSDLVDYPGYYNNIYSSSLIKANLVINSRFINNSFLSKDYEEELLDAREVYYSTFVSNSAAYGGAIGNVSEVHYCVFVNNTATYGGDDIFVYKGNLNCSSNWWGSNQKPGKERVQVFIGILTIEDWVILSIVNNHDVITASLDSVLDNSGNISNILDILPSRDVLFYSQYGILNPTKTILVNNSASSLLTRNTTLDFDVYAQVDNQNISLRVYNNSTRILMKDVELFGKNHFYDISLINVNGHRISNQDLTVMIYRNNTIFDTFTLTTDVLGNAGFEIDYPIGFYNICVYYFGNGYFDKSNSSAIIEISPISTSILSRNYTYYGKNNRFYAILADGTGRYILNQELRLKVFDLKNKQIAEALVKTGEGGRSEVLLSLDTGDYRLNWDFEGNEWYTKSHSESYISIKPINTTIILPNITFYGKDNNYQLTFKDAYGKLINGEEITLTIYNSTDSVDFKLITNNGVASININLLPGVYNLNAVYNGDDIYGSSLAKASLNIQPIFVSFDFNSHPIVPERGVFTVIVLDMYNKRVSGENISLELFNKNINKKYWVISDGAGEANFRVDVGEGIYMASIEYGGNTWYSKASNAAILEVTHNSIINKVYINASDFVQYFGENKYFLINFNDSSAYSLEAKKVKASISSGDWVKSYDLESDVFGQVRLQITLEPGEYNITYKYSNDYYNLFASGSSSILVYAMPTVLSASNMVLNYGQANNFEVKLTNKNGLPLSNLVVNINVDGKSYNCTTNSKGIAKVLVNLDLGYHNITYFFENKNYISSNGSATVLVVDDLRSSTILESGDINPHESQLINYPVFLHDILDNPITSSEIILNITDDEGNILNIFKEYTNASGYANFKLNLNYGNYILSACYNGNDKYLMSFNTNNVHVSPLENVSETILFGNDCEVVNGNAGTRYFVVLTTLEGEFIKNKEIEFIVKHNSYFSVTDEFGRAYLDVPFSPGSYSVTSIFNGSNNLTKVKCVNYISVYGNVINLYSRDVVKSYNNATQYYVALFDALNNPLANKTIQFRLFNNTYNKITDKNGFACFDELLGVGKYEITATYQGYYPDEYGVVNNTITVLPTIYGYNLTKYYGNSMILVITFFNSTDDPLENTDVPFMINGVKSVIKTDSNGLILIDYSNVANYNIICINPTSGEMGEYSYNVLSTIASNNLVKYYKGNTKFSAKFLDKSGALLKNTKVKFILNGKTYWSKTNLNGVAYLKTNFKPGSYSIVSVNTNTGQKITNKIVIKKTIISKNIVLKYPKKTIFKVKILSKNGKALKGVKVKVKIKGKTYKIKTNSKGMAKLKIKLKKGKYKVTTSYGGLSVKNTIKVIK